jgi:hypothetical protein
MCVKEHKPAAVLIGSEAWFWDHALGSFLSGEPLAGEKWNELGPN